MRRGFTLPELLSVLGIVAILLSVTLPPLSGVLDRAAVREGVERFASLHAATRQLAVARGRLARLELDPQRTRATISVQRAPQAWDTVASYELGSARLTCSNGTITFGPFGLGFGASNTRVVFSRGVAADTVTTSRTGRLKRR
jgi:prepilin-type N-terminal cleavage/methylation domain-containing protein